MVREMNTRGGIRPPLGRKSSAVEPIAGETIMPSALYSDIFRMNSVWRATDSLVLHRKTVRPVFASASSRDASSVLKNGSDTLLTMTPTVSVFEVRSPAALR